MRILLRRSIAVILSLAGAPLCYVGGWLVVMEVLPQIRATGWSLRGNSTILNREWPGNQLYLLVALYLLLGVSLVLGGVFLWRRRAAPSGSSGSII